MPQKTKEIDKRIRSVRNTQQITKAMKMVAAAKLRRAEDRLRSSRPYAARLTQLLAGLAGAASTSHPFFEQRPLRKRLVVVISSDKGLCGSYNANLIKQVHRWLDEHSDGVQNEIYAIGRKGSDYFGRRPWPVRKAVTDFGGVVVLDRINLIADEVMQLFVKDEYQEVVAFYSRFISTISSKPTEAQLLPLSAGEAPDSGAYGAAQGAAHAGTHGAGAASAPAATTDYIYEPGATLVLHALLPKAVRNRMYMALVESFASEHGARMASMSAATDNAGELIDRLVLFRNRARQAAITQEISEIVGGAEALV